MKKVFTSLFSLLISLVANSSIYAKSLGNFVKASESHHECSPLVLVKSSVQNHSSILSSETQHSSYASHRSPSFHSSHYSMRIRVKTDSIENINNADIQRVKHELAKKHNVDFNKITISNIYIANNNRIYWDLYEGEKDIYNPPANTRSLYIKYSLIDFSAEKKEISTKYFEYIIPFPKLEFCLHLNKTKKGGYAKREHEVKSEWMNLLLEKYE